MLICWRRSQKPRLVRLIVSKDSNWTQNVIVAERHYKRVAHRCSLTWIHFNPWTSDSTIRSSHHALSSLSFCTLCASGCCHCQPVLSVLHGQGKCAHCRTLIAWSTLIAASYRRFLHYSAWLRARWYRTNAAHLRKERSATRTAVRTTWQL